RAGPVCGEPEWELHRASSQRLLPPRRGPAVPRAVPPAFVSRTRPHQHPSPIVPVAISCHAGEWGRPSVSWCRTVSGLPRAPRIAYRRAVAETQLAPRAERTPLLPTLVRCCTALAATPPRL